MWSLKRETWHAIVERWGRSEIHSKLRPLASPISPSSLEQAASTSFSHGFCVLGFALAEPETMPQTFVWLVLLLQTVLYHHSLGKAFSDPCPKDPLSHSITHHLTYVLMEAGCLSCCLQIYVSLSPEYKLCASKNFHLFWKTAMLTTVPPMLSGFSPILFMLNLQGSEQCAQHKASAQ
jgi:hypothetical protein